MAKRRGRNDWLPANIRVPQDDNWTHAVYADCDFDEMVDCANSFDGNADEDWRIELYGLLDQLAIRALVDRSLLNVAVEVIGRHMRLVPRKWAPLGILGLKRLLDAEDEDVRKAVINHANRLDAERQIEIFRHFAPDTRNEEDRILAEQVNLLEVQEKYGFKPKFYIGKSSVFSDVPAFLVDKPE